MRTVRNIGARWRICVRAIFAILATLGFTAFAGADNAQDVRGGKELAVRVCSPCHAMAAQPIQEQAAPPSGPSFEEIAKGTKATPEALRVFLLSTQSNVGHPGGMPNPKLTEDQIHLISAYLSSLRDVKK